MIGYKVYVLSINGNSDCDGEYDGVTYKTYHEANKVRKQAIKESLDNLDIIIQEVEIDD